MRLSRYPGIKVRVTFFNKSRSVGCREHFLRTCLAVSNWEHSQKWSCLLMPLVWKYFPRGSIHAIKFIKKTKILIRPRIELGTFCVLSRCHDQLDHRTNCWKLILQQYFKINVQEIKQILLGSDKALFLEFIIKICSYKNHLIFLVLNGYFSLFSFDYVILMSGQHWKCSEWQLSNETPICVSFRYIIFM